MRGYCNLIGIQCLRIKIFFLETQGYCIIDIKLCLWIEPMFGRREVIAQKLWCLCKRAFWEIRGCYIWCLCIEIWGKLLQKWGKIFLHWRNNIFILAVRSFQSFFSLYVYVHFCNNIVRKLFFLKYRHCARNKVFFPSFQIISLFCLYVNVDY